jgi:hypothetical protein
MLWNQCDHRESVRPGYGSSMGRAWGIIRDSDPGPTQGIDEALERRLIERVGNAATGAAGKKELFFCNPTTAW